MRNFKEIFKKFHLNLTKTQILIEIIGTMIFTHMVSLEFEGSSFITLQFILSLLMASDFFQVYFNPIILILKMMIKNERLPLKEFFILLFAEIIGAIIQGFLSVFVFKSTNNILIKNFEQNWIVSDFFGELIGKLKKN